MSISSFTEIALIRIKTKKAIYYFKNKLEKVFKDVPRDYPMGSF